MWTRAFPIIGVIKGWRPEEVGNHAGYDGWRGTHLSLCTSSRILSPCMGGNSRLWHRVVAPARQATHTWAGGLVRQPYAGDDYIPQSGNKNLASGNEKFARGGGSVFSIL
jgi:hypothetical protein